MHGLAKFVTAVEEAQMKKDLIPLRIGMTVKVGVTVVEGSKTRVQPYQGLIIAKHNHQLNSTITVRKTFQGVGVERVFPVHSPLITIEEVEQAGVPRVRSHPCGAAASRRSRAQPPRARAPPTPPHPAAPWRGLGRGRGGAGRRGCRRP